MYNIKTERKKIIPTYLVSVRYERLAEGKGQEKRAQEKGTRRGHEKRARDSTNVLVHKSSQNYCK